jgi:hypothetical protein
MPRVSANPRSCLILATSCHLILIKISSISTYLPPYRILYPSYDPKFTISFRSIPVGYLSFQRTYHLSYLGHCGLSSLAVQIWLNHVYVSALSIVCSGMWLSRRP